MKKIIFYTIAFLSLALSANATQPEKTLKVISFNIRQSQSFKPDGRPVDGTNAWMFRYGATIEMMEKELPDVMGVQEMCQDQKELIFEHFNGKYKYVGVGRDDGRKKGEIMAIWYNPKTVAVAKWGTFWLSETPSKPTKGWDAACFRTATWAIIHHKPSGHSFLMINTHLDHEGSLAREESLKLILAKVQEINKKGLPVVLTGDFNATLDSDLIQEFNTHYTQARQAAQNTDFLASFNGWGKKSSIIDYIYYSGFAGCQEFKTLTKKYADKPFISDHFPIQAILEF